MACCHSLISGAAARRVGPEHAKAGRSRAGRGRHPAGFEAGYGNLVWVRTGDPDLKPIRSAPPTSRP